MNVSRREASLFGDAANALNIPPGEYGRKIKTQRNRRGPAQVVEHVVKFENTRRTLPSLDILKNTLEIEWCLRELLYRCCTAVVSSCREMLGSRNERNPRH